MFKYFFVISEHLKSFECISWVRFAPSSWHSIKLAAYYGKRGLCAGNCDCSNKFAKSAGRAQLENNCNRIKSYSKFGKLVKRFANNFPLDPRRPFICGQVNGLITYSTYSSYSSFGPDFIQARCAEKFPLSGLGFGKCSNCSNANVTNFYHRVFAACFKWILFWNFSTAKVGRNCN